MALTKIVIFETSYSRTEKLFDRLIFAFSPFNENFQDDHFQMKISEMAIFPDVPKL